MPVIRNFCYLVFIILLYSCSQGESPIVITSVEKVVGSNSSGEIALKFKVSVKKDAKAEYSLEQVNFDIVNSMLRSIEKVTAGSIIQKNIQTESASQVADLFSQEGGSLILKKGESTEASKEIKLQFMPPTPSSDETTPNKFPQDTRYVQVRIKIKPLNDEQQDDGDVFERSEYFQIEFQN